MKYVLSAKYVPIIIVVLVVNRYVRTNVTTKYIPTCTKYNYVPNLVCQIPNCQFPNEPKGHSFASSCGV